MLRFSALVNCAALLAVCVAPADADPNENDWPQWRGATGDNKAPAADVPLIWGEEENLLWKTPVPGRGHSSPTVRGDYVFLTTADEQQHVQSILAFDRQSGKLLWSKQVFEGGMDDKAHRRNTQATPSVACSDDRLFASFMNDGHVWVLSFDFTGNELWRANVGEFASHWGYSASPILYEGNVIIAADHKQGGYLAAFTQASGSPVWTTARPADPNYPSPIVHHVSGKDQLLMAGLDRIASYSPKTGKLLWETAGVTTECVGTVVVEGDLAFASGGYPGNVTMAVKTDGSGEVVWQNRVKVYVPSMLTHDGLLYAVTDNGIAYCWDAATGDEQWKKRLGGTFNTSPVLAGDKIVAACEDGTTYVLATGGAKCQVLAENQLGNEVYATPTFAGNRAYIRYAVIDGDARQEYLACIGEK